MAVGGTPWERSPTTTGWTGQRRYFHSINFQIRCGARPTSARLDAIFQTIFSSRIWPGKPIGAFRGIKPSTTYFLIRPMVWTGKIIRTRSKKRPILSARTAGGVGLPRISDGQLLLLHHLISMMLQ